jgi:NAD+ kinase
MLNRFGIVIKPNKPDAISLAQEIIPWLTQRKVQVYVEEKYSSLIPHSPTFPRKGMSQWIDCLIVLGGDGTLLSAARDMAAGPGQVPILGVNLGGLGFLTEITLEELYPALENILHGKEKIEKRMRISAKVLRQENAVGGYFVLNDVVITKSVLARIINLRNHIDGAYVTTYRGDGIIISTPTGSTAYSLAAGGPIIYPAMESILITPICPHTLTNRPLLIPDHATIEFILESEESDVSLTLDGQVGFPLRPFDRVIITKAKDPVLFIRSPFKEYFEILRTKLKWGER